jgi:hypothetical protein
VQSRAVSRLKAWKILTIANFEISLIRSAAMVKFSDAGLALALAAFIRNQLVTTAQRRRQPRTGTHNTVEETPDGGRLIGEQSFAKAVPRESDHPPVKPPHAVA